MYLEWIHTCNGSQACWSLSHTVFKFELLVCLERLQLDLENNGASLPSSDASMTENVAPEPEPVEAAEDVLPLEDVEDVLPVEDVVPVLEEPTFRVSFQNENGQTEVTVEGVDQDMLLFDLTLAFKESGVRSAYTSLLILPLFVCCVRKMIRVFVTQLSVAGASHGVSTSLSATSDISGCLS